MNFIIEKYLSNILEIDTSKTKASIFSGIINLKNLKIKSEIFESINLPNFEIIHGYIGSMTIKLKMPRFYKYPINVEIEKVFIHIRQKNIDNILKEEAIKSMEKYKNQLLLNEEELREKWEKVDNEESGIFQQILNDLQIEIREVVLHYEDAISYKEVPFTFGVILNKIMIRSANKDYIIDENIKENLNYQEINYKVFNIDSFSIFLDCYDNINSFNKQTLSLMSSKKLVSKDLFFFLENKICDYYSYCMKELTVFSKSKNSHQYILYKMKLNVNISTNDNYLKNKLPQYTVSINLPSLNIRFTLKQIKTLFKVMAFYNLNRLYQDGIVKEYYNRDLKQTDIDLYMENYINYYQEKFYEKNETIQYPSYLKNIENRLSIEDIQNMRRIAYKKLEYINEYIKIKKELELEEDKWYGKDSEKINKLKKDLEKIEEQKNNLKLEMPNKNKNEKIKETIKEKYQELNEKLSDANSSMNFTINKIKFIIYENAKTNNKDKQWEYKDILIKFIFTSFDIDGKILQNSLKLSMSLDNLVISHEKSKNKNYQKFLFGDIENRGKVLYMVFEKNPNFEKSDYKFQMIGEKRIHIIYDNHIFNYIYNKVMNVLNTTINFGEINTYVRQDSNVNLYIMSGYSEYLFENFQHFNIDLYINLISPIILLPLDPFTTDDNNQCILLRLGRLEIVSELPPRQEKGKNYRIITNEELMYDIYKVNLYGTKLSTITDCTPVNNCVEYQEFETKIIRDFDLFVNCKKIIEMKNPFLDDLVCELNISKVEMKLDEFQILLIIDYLGNYFKDNKNIFEENEIDKFLGIGLEKEDEEEAINNFRAKYIIKNIQKKGDINKEAKLPETKIEETTSNKEDENSFIKDQTRGMLDVIKEENEIKTDANEGDQKSGEKSETLIIEAKIKDDKKGKIQNNENKNEENKKKDSFERIKEIKIKKRSMHVKFIMNEMTLTLRKVHYDLSRENFIILIQKAFEFDYYMMDNNDMLTLLRMKNIYLFDKDIDIKKFNIIKEQFQCLINSTKNINNNTMSFIDMTSLYRKIDGATEIDTIFNMNDLNIIISFDSLLRIYQFSMYYYDKYNEKMYEIEHPKEENKTINSKKKDNNISLSSKEIIVNRNNFRNYTEAITNKNIGKFKRLNDIQRTRRRKSTNDKNLKRERIDSKITVIYDMKNTIFKIPLNPKKSSTPIVSFSFDLIYNQNSRNVYTNVLRLPQNLLIEKMYEIQDFNMNLLISKVYLNIEFKDFDSTNYIYENEKIISNFRMSFFSSSFLYLPQRQSMTITNLNLEPLYCKFGVKQMGIILEFYSKLKSFWFDFNNIKYIPYMRPEYIVDGKVVVQPIKKKTFRECVLRIMIALYIRKSFQTHLNYIRAKYKKKKSTKIDNISDFNSHYEMEIKFGKVIMTFYDNVSAEKRLLLNLNIFQIYMKSISNTKVKDKNNVCNLIKEMLIGDDLPIEAYNIDTLANYMYINFGLEINYFNLIINEFEPLLEKIKFDYLFFQTCPFSRKKNYLNIKDMINFNISSNAIKVINLFLLRYYQKEQQTKKNVVKYAINSKKKESTKKLQNANQEPNKEISLLLMNFTELNIDIIFEANYNNKYTLKPKGNLTFYKTDLFLDRNHNNYSSTLNAIIMKKAIIKGINYGRNNTRQYKLKVEIGTKEYYLYLNVKVNTSGLIKQVHFCPSISFFNDTIYKEIEIFVKIPKLKKNFIVVSQNERCFVPLKWALYDPPLSYVYMKIKNNIEPVKIYNHINDAIIKPLDEEEKSQKKDDKKKIEKEAKNNKNKYWNQNVINSFLSECDNRKDNKKVIFNEDNNKIYLFIDYYFAQSKEIKEILKEKEKESKSNNLEDTTTTLDEYYNDYSYSYLLYIRPYATFYNQLPFNLIYTHGNSVEKTIKTLNKSSLYSCLQDEQERIRITFYYNGEKYRSPYFDITNSDSVELLNYSNLAKDNLSCYILKSTKIVELKKDFNYDVTLNEFSSSSYEYTFFFKYLIMNKMPNSLWTRPYKNKNKKGKITETELKSGQLTVINNTNINKYILKEENSRWTKPFDLKAIKGKGTIEIETEIEKEEKKIINTIDISCILSWGKNYDNSRILIFQQQFLLHNKLNFNIYYRQEKDSEKTNHFLKKETFESIICIKDKKKIFRLGLFDTNSGEFNYSSPFDIGILKTSDLLIKINEVDKDKYDSNCLYTNNNKNYYVLIRIESHIFEDGLVYLSITTPYFPSLKIENETEASVKILESKSDSKPLIVDNKLKKGFPYVWKNNSEEKSSLIFEIYGIQKSFSFSKYDKFSFEVEKEEESKKEETKSNISNDTGLKKQKQINYYVYTKNKSLTRCLKIEEIDNFKPTIEPKKAGANLIIRNNNKVITTSFNIRLRGIGFSIINEALKELFYISFYCLKIKYESNLLISEKHTLSENTENLIFHLSNFQIDYCLHDSIKYIIAPKKQVLPSSDGNYRNKMNEVILLEDKIKSSEEKDDGKKEVPFISFLVSRQCTQYLKTMEESTIYRQIDLIIQQFKCKIDQYTLTNLLNIISEFMELLNYSKKKEEESNNEDLKLLNEKTSERIKKSINNKSGSKVLINYLFLSSMKIYLTIRLNLSELYTTGITKVITRVLGSIGNSLTRFTDIPLIFTEKGFENIYISLSEILWIIFEEYKNKGTKQIITIIGSSDLIGNPVKLLEGIGTGFYELVNEPRKGFIHGPLQFGMGIAKGLGKLLSGIIGGTFGVVESITGTLYSATQSLMGRNNEYILDEEESPNNIASGAIQGLYGGFKELTQGVTGVVLHPIKETKKSGVKGFFKGLGKGFIGLVISPFAAIFRIVHSFVSGTKNTLDLILGNSRIKTKRFRHPRALHEGNEPLRPYDFEKAEAKEALFKVMKMETNHIDYAHYFICANKGFDKGFSLFIKTDTIVVVLYEAKKIIFYEKLRNIKKCEIHFINEEYVIKFCRAKGSGRGFKVMKDFYTIVCKIYDLFSENKMKEFEKKSIFTNDIKNNMQEENDNEENDQYEIINVNDEKSDKYLSDIQLLGDGKKESKKEEIININNIYNINNINNIYNINNINNIQNIYNRNPKNNSNKYETSIKEDTVINDNSVFYSNTIENLSEDSNYSKALNKKYKITKKVKEDSLSRNNLNDIYSKDNFLPKKILSFSESSSSSK